MTALLSLIRRVDNLSWIMLISAIVFAASMAVILWVPSPPSKTGRLCDEAVHQLLATQDPVELRRAMFLVRWFDCSISRRLP